METLDENLTQSNNTSVAGNRESAEFMYEMAKWARFISIVGLVVMGLFTLVMLGTLAFSSSIFSNAFGLEEGNMATFVTIFFIAYIIFLCLPLYYLLTAANMIRAGINNNDQDKYTEGVKNLKSHYKFIGIFMVVVLSIYALLIVFGIITAMAV